MSKKMGKEKSGVSGKLVWGVALAVGSAVAAFVAKKFFAKKNELAAPSAEEATAENGFEATEDNYITLDNDVAPTAEATEQAAEAVETASAEAETTEEATEEVAETEMVSLEEEATETAADDDTIKCIKE